MDNPYHPSHHKIHLDNLYGRTQLISFMVNILNVLREEDNLTFDQLKYTNQLEDENKKYLAKLLIVMQGEGYIKLSDNDFTMFVFSVSLRFKGLWLAHLTNIKNYGFND